MGCYTGKNLHRYSQEYKEEQKEQRQKFNIVGLTKSEPWHDRVDYLRNILMEVLEKKYINNQLSFEKAAEYFNMLK